MDEDELDDALDEWWDGLSEDQRQSVLAVRHSPFDYNDPVRAIIDSSGLIVTPPEKDAAGAAPGATRADCLMPDKLHDYFGVRWFSE